MLCIFFFLFVNVFCETNSPLLPVANKQVVDEIPKQVGKNILPMLSQPNFAQNIIQNKTLLSQLAEADPAVVNQIIGLLENLLEENTILSDGLQADVDQALIYKNANASDLAAAQDDKTDADEALAAAIIVVNDRQDDFDAAVIAHGLKVQDQADQQPILTTEAGIINEALDLLRGLIGQTVTPKTVTLLGKGQCEDGATGNVPQYLYRSQSWENSLTSDQCKEKALGFENAIGFALIGCGRWAGDDCLLDGAAGQCNIYFPQGNAGCEDGAMEDTWNCTGDKNAQAVTTVNDHPYAVCWKID